MLVQQRQRQAAVAIAVPSAPLSSPAAESVCGVRRGRHDVIESSVIASTPAPTTVKNARGASVSTISTPTAVPGTRPSAAQRTPCQSTWPRSRNAEHRMYRGGQQDRAGEQLGLTIATTGIATSVSPNPTMPWTTAPSDSIRPATNSDVDIVIGLLLERL